jgi:Xaa-Pro aminopeptidase
MLNPEPTKLSLPGKKMNRLDALRQLAFEKEGFDGFAVFDWANLLYLAGFSGTVSLFIPRDDESIVYAYGVNYEQVKAEGKGFRVELVKRGEKLMTKIAEDAKNCKTKRLAVDALSINDWRILAKGTRGNATLKVKGNFVEELRKVKDEEEIALMRRAGELTSEGMKAAYEMLEPSVKEYEVAAEIEYAMRKRGSYGTAFETIIASGPCSAFPHGGCSDREIREGDLVVVDLGAAYKFYRSDMTRTLVAGKPSERQKRIYQIVKTAQEKAFETIKSNVKAKDVDAAARKIIEDAGYGECFVHSLGHGVGLEVHEAPALSPESVETLAVGNVVTDEPGIYLVGYGGVRIEDTILVQKNESGKLTVGPYTLTRE